MNNEKEKTYKRRRKKFVDEYKVVKDEPLKKNLKIAIVYTDLCWYLFGKLVKGTEYSFEKLQANFEETLKLKDEYLSDSKKADNEIESNISDDYRNSDEYKKQQKEFEDFDKKALAGIEETISAIASANKFTIEADMHLLNHASKTLFGEIFKKDNFDEWENSIIEGFKLLVNVSSLGTASAIYDFINNVKNQRVQNIKIVEDYTKFYREYMNSSYSWAVFTAVRVLQLTRKDEKKKVEVNEGILLVNQLAKKIYDNLKV